MNQTHGRPRRFHWGAEWDAGEASFRIWAPKHRQVRLRLGGRDRDMKPIEGGWFSLEVDAQPGAEYLFVLEDGRAIPDPAARAQAGDVHAPSLVVDPNSYRWRNGDWPGRPWEEAVISEIHVGTFTPEGTFRAAIERLPHIAETGVTAIEIMPVAQFAGNRGWGYDGVLLYAPHRAYGAPDDLKALIDAAHGHGLMVLLDVVYNHFGPEGNYLDAVAPDFFDATRHTPWGAAIAYEREPVRRFFIENAFYWLDEYRVDGFRFDATDHVLDPRSPVEILIEIAEEIRHRHPDGHIHLTTEDSRNIIHLHARGPAGEVRLHTAEWNDDWHNAAHVLVTGEDEGYYEDYTGDSSALLARALAEGFAYQGEPSRHHDGEPRGMPSADLPPVAFVDFLQNHDQIGNRAFGERLITQAEPALLRALTEILLLSPHVPLLFMGQEWGETCPFRFFTDFHGDLAGAVREGRRREFRHFTGFRNPDARERIPDPNDPATFAASRIDWSARETPEGRDWLRLTRALLEIRHREIVPYLGGAGGRSGRLVEGRGGRIAVDWALSRRTLRLRANVSDGPATLPPASGRIIHATEGAEPEGPLPRCGVVVMIEPEGGTPP